MRPINARKKYILSKLPKPYQALYTASFGSKLPYELRRPLVNEIETLLTRFKSLGTDRLQDKAKEYPEAGSWGVAQNRMLARQIYDDNGVDTIELGDALSVEIECIFPSERDLNTFIKLCSEAKLRSAVCVKNDGSIRANEESVCHEHDDCDTDCESRESNGEIGKEIVVTFSEKKPETLIQVSLLLTRCGAFVNKSCGLHVHFDMRNKDIRAVNTYTRRLASCVPNLKKMLPESRRKNSYCQLDSNTIKSSQRYAFINATAYRKHKTLEIRGHSGTISSEKILNWVKLLKLIMNHTKVVKEINFFEMLAQLECPNSLYDYCKSRYMLFEGFKLEPGVIPVFELEPTDTETYNESVAA